MEFAESSLGRRKSGPFGKVGQGHQGGGEILISNPMLPDAILAWRDRGGKSQSAIRNCDNLRIDRLSLLPQLSPSLATM